MDNKNPYETILSKKNPPINFCGPSSDKTDHVIQNRTLVIRGSSSGFISTEEKPRNEQTLKLTF